MSGRRATSRVAACLAIGWLAVGGCLPDDDRPSPSSLLVTAAPSEATKNGFETEDGWSIRFDRFVAAAGDIRLRDAERGDDTCVEYGETYYEWLFDFTVAEREKIGLAHGLGDCQVEFSLRGPSDDTVLGPGATEEDLAFMIVESSDAYAEDHEVSVWVEGQAQLEGVTKRFSWAFRRSYEVEKCADEGGGSLFNELELVSGGSAELEIEIRGEELFRMGPDDAAPLHFDLFAEADRDGDGILAWGELETMIAPDQTVYGDPNEWDPELDGPGTQGAISLAGLVYRRLLPRVARVAGGPACEAELDD